MESIKNKMVMTGISYGAAICEIENISEILEYQLELIEIPFGESVYFDRLVEFAKGNGMNVSFHIPSMEMVEFFPFILDTQTYTQINVLVQYVSYFLEKYISKTEIKPVYIVIHFPLISRIKEMTVRQGLNEYFLKQMSDCIKKYNIPLLVENVAVDNTFFQGKDYKTILTEIDGICFDIGHSYTAEYILGLSEHTDLVGDMFTELSNYIQCIHLYNTVKTPHNGYSPRLHYPFGIVSDRCPEFMNEKIILNHIRNLPNLKYVIYEPHRSQVLEYGDIGSLR